MLRCQAVAIVRAGPLPDGVEDILVGEHVHAGAPRPVPVHTADHPQMHQLDHPPLVPTMEPAAVPVRVAQSRLHGLALTPEAARAGLGA